MDAVIGEQLHQIHILRRHLLRSITRNVRWAGTGHPHTLGRWVGQDVVHDLLRPGTAGGVVRTIPLRDVRVDRAAHLQDRHELHTLAATHLIQRRDELLGVGTTDDVHRPLGVQITVGAVLLGAIEVPLQDQVILIEADLATIRLRRWQQRAHFLERWGQGLTGRDEGVVAEG